MIGRVHASSRASQPLAAVGYRLSTVAFRPIAVLEAWPANVCCAAISGGRSHTLGSRSQQHSGHSATALAAAGMTGIEGTADIVILGTLPDSTLRAGSPPLVDVTARNSHLIIVVAS